MTTSHLPMAEPTPGAPCTLCIHTSDSGRCPTQYSFNEPSDNHYTKTFREQIITMHLFIQVFHSEFWPSSSLM